MQDKLCIIISSVYAETESVLNAEVQRDLTTVKETLSDHTCVEITVPVIAGETSAKRLTAQVLETIQSRYATCHIVLNTHGAGGVNDIKDECVKMVVQDMSEKGIPITQLSALQCNGMLGQSATEVRAANPMIPLHATVSAKKASMEILQAKLNAMITKEAQNFDIFGFGSAYDPISEKEAVVDLLNGEGGVTLNVSTARYIPVSPTRYATQILKNVEIIEQSKATERYQSMPAYIRATNMLGLAITEMKEKVFFHLENCQPIPAEFQPLLTAVEDYCRAPPRDRPQAVPLPLDASNFFRMYKYWLKDKKLHSDERIGVFKKYSETVLIEATISAKAQLRALSTDAISGSPYTTEEDFSSEENPYENDSGMDVGGKKTGRF